MITVRVVAADHKSQKGQTGVYRGQAPQKYLRFLGFPEGSEGKRPEEFLLTWLNQTFGEESFSHLFSIERAHWVPLWAPPPERFPRPLLAWFLYFRDKETILLGTCLVCFITTTSPSFRIPLLRHRNNRQHLKMWNCASVNAVCHTVCYILRGSEWCTKARANSLPHLRKPITGCLIGHFYLYSCIWLPILSASSRPGAYICWQVKVAQD